MTKPSIAVVIVAYNRPNYLNQLLDSLLEQDDKDCFELVVLDNGSPVPLEVAIKGRLEEFRGRATLLREQVNVVGPSRWIKAISAAKGEFVLIPGDDDVVLPNFISTSRSLAGTSDSVTMISMGMQAIDSDGKRLPQTWKPPVYENQQEAIAKLLCSCSYTMPSSGFRKDSIDLDSIPRSRTAFDWALWLNAWTAGIAAVSNSQTVLYRQHPGQEQLFYSQQAFRLDASRMLVEYVTSERFNRTLATWTKPQLFDFAEYLLNSNGPGSADTRWAPLVQLLVADKLVKRGDPSPAVELHAQASAQSGVIPDLGALQAFTEESVISSLPAATWTRIPISATWEADCQLATEWQSYLNMPERDAAMIRIRFSCTCRSSTSHKLKIEMSRIDIDDNRAIAITGHPSPANSSLLFEALGIMVGRQHGFEIMPRAEEVILKVARRARRTKVGMHLVHWYKARTQPVSDEKA